MDAKLSAMEERLNQLVLSNLNKILPTSVNKRIQTQLSNEFVLKDEITMFQKNGGQSSRYSKQMNRRPENKSEEYFTVTDKVETQNFTDSQIK